MTREDVRFLSPVAFVTALLQDQDARLGEYRFILTLGLADGEHETEIVPSVLVGVSLGAQSTSDWIPFVCGQCQKPFRIAFLFGMPFFWDDETSEHPQPQKSMGLRIVSRM
jgi:hypothetical protein